MSSLKSLLSFSYWFNLDPVPFIRPVWIALGVIIIVFFLLSVTEKYLAFHFRKSPPLHRVFSRLGRSGLWISVIAAMFYFFNFEGLRTVSARFWWVLIVVGALVWKGLILWDAKKHYAEEKKAFLDRKEKEKYL